MIGYNNRSEDSGYWISDNSGLLFAHWEWNLRCPVEDFKNLPSDYIDNENGHWKVGQGNGIALRRKPNAITNKPNSL